MAAVDILQQSGSMHNGIPTGKTDATIKSSAPHGVDSTDTKALEECIDRSKIEERTERSKIQSFERKMGDTELSYYLPSRADGVNDMYLHLGFTAHASLCAPARILAVWALLRLRHPPLAAQVVAKEWEYKDVRFIYSPPTSHVEAFVDAQQSFSFKRQGPKELIDDYLNGDRSLGEQRLSQLVIASLSDEDAEEKQCDFLLCTVHFLGDGMALHRFANDFFTLLAGNAPVEEGSETRPYTLEELEKMVLVEWEKRWGTGLPEFVHSTNVLPLAVEDTLPPIKSRFRRAAAKVDFKLSLEKDIGGHAFPRRKYPKRHTIVPTVPLDEQKTKLVLKRCKEKGVSIANVLFALSSIAWSRVCAKANGKSRSGLGWEQPLMMYSALNLRPYLLPVANAPDSSYWFVSIGYFNVVLPSFLPSSSSEEDEHVAVEKTLWHRSREAKKQSSYAVKNPMVIARTHEMAALRGERARQWAREDDEKAKGVASPVPAPIPSATFTLTTAQLKADNANFAVTNEAAKLGAAPSTALLGLSLLGNLDGMYKHADYPRLRLTALTTGSRQRPGGLLLFGYTFVGKLWLCLGYDECAFDVGGEDGEKKRTVEGWWEEVLRGVDEFLVGGKA